mgnify:FL=1
MVGSFYRFWVACAVVVVSGIFHAFWLAPEVWEGTQAASTQAGLAGLWEPLRGMMALLPGLGLIFLWERSRSRSAEPVRVEHSEAHIQKKDRKAFQDKQAAA